ncbi:Gfo/Idh/MocA family oxidoreductase [Bradyrhizobium sp. WSM 1738]|uniref:Gfo/Idh/MocA family protein n=1 Tax=Bradyrhizobium hereditatis TaxID=2821405 RepID=UPI001CE2D20D|nr:Gfo/Idh/MocA family oxidoreductase [Bradyrhizobium hereditatis]MCA6119219.1 Gfo/Idh/MocA family oxidoreductase [Bradyrhizobium hereditatis]
MTQASIEGSRAPTTARPRVGFLGVGWIGHHRMRAIAEADVVEIAAVADPADAMIAQTVPLAPDAKALSTFEELLDQDIDGVVIATPTALHAEQSIRALAHGKAVFCQKPLGRTAEEVRAVIDTARSANRLLAVDLSYRFTEAMRHVRRLVNNGELGHVYAVELTFHNAYGPDKPWFYDPALAGGGCVMDLGVHLVDLALWALDFPKVVRTSSRLFANGQLLSTSAERVEDYALATIDLETGATVHLTCSWRLPAGRDAVISAAFYGTRGGAAMRNINGSFYDFVGELYRGTASETLAAPPDAWFGRATVEWARALAAGTSFDPSVERCADVAAVLDRIYGR